MWAPRLVLLAAICAAAVAQSGGPVLLFHDGSPSAERHVGAWSAAHATRAIVVDVNSTDAFVTQLFRGGWSRIIILADFSAPHDILAAALSDYAVEFAAGLDVQMLLLHAGQTSGFVVCNWSNGWTSTGYSGLDSEDPAAGNAVATPGYTYPLLADLKFRPASPVTFDLSARPLSASDRERGISEDPCEQCALDYAAAIEICNNDRTARIAVCDGLYGPGAQPPHSPNPAEHSTCIATANNHHTNCVKAAADDFKLCELYHSCNAGGGKK